MGTTDERLAALFDEAKHKALALLKAEQQREDSATRQTAPEWMTDEELACHWRLFNREGEPVTAGIRSWVKRGPDDHPLPHAYMGDLLRFRREEVDKWAVEEAERRRAAGRRKSLKLA